MKERPEKGILTGRNGKALVKRAIYEPDKAKELKTTRVNNLFNKVLLEIAASFEVGPYSEDLNQNGARLPYMHLRS